jgi:hypothetical protein
MKTKATIILFLALTAMSLGKVNAQPNPGPHHPRHFTAKMVHFREDMRKLWEDHITWTRNVIFNVLDDLPGTTEAVGRLLQNQDDIGDAIKPYYGNAAGDQLTALLYSHINIAATILTALKNNDNATLVTASQQWTENADSIAMFLSTANPYLDFTEMQTMMHDHLALTTDEALARKNQDYAADVLAYDAVHLEILEMSDMISTAIIRQFPSEFRGNNREMNIDVMLSDGETVLSQNAPNPFTEQTIIPYYIPDYVNQAEINFYNSSGSLIKTVPITDKGEGTITVNAFNLRKGVYTYSIVVDGKVLDTKQMIH